MKVPADQYLALKKKQGELAGKLGFSFPADSLEPVDLNGAYVAFNTTQEAKGGEENVTASGKCTNERFGLTEAGV